MLTKRLAFVIVLLSVAPAPATGQGSVADRALNDARAQWLQRKGVHADIYVLAGSAAARSMPWIVSDAERAIAANLEWLGERDPKGRLKLFFVGSRDEMRPFTGTRAGGWSIVAEGTAFFVANDTVRPPLIHETMHLLSWRLWGMPGGRWLSEGVASLSAGGCRDWTIDQIGAALYHDRLLATIPEMRKQFRTGGIQGAVNYLSAASLVSFIDQTWGRDRLRELWRSGGMGGAQQVLGASPLAIERRWRMRVAGGRAPATWSAMSREIERYGCE